MHARRSWQCLLLLGCEAARLRPALLAPGQVGSTGSKFRLKASMPASMTTQFFLGNAGMDGRYFTALVRAWGPGCTRGRHAAVLSRLASWNCAASEACRADQVPLWMPAPTRTQWGWVEPMRTGGLKPRISGLGSGRRSVPSTTVWMLRRCACMVVVPVIAWFARLPWVRLPLVDFPGAQTRRWPFPQRPVASDKAEPPAMAQGWRYVQGYWWAKGGRRRPRHSLRFTPSRYYRPSTAKRGRPAQVPSRDCTLDSD